MTTTADIATQLETTFGLAGVELRYGLSQDELFHEAIAHDRGRVEIDGSDDAQKASPPRSESTVRSSTSPTPSARAVP